MLRDLKVQFKILLFPVIALVFFLLSYATTRYMAQQNDMLAKDIEKKFVPTMELNRSLEYLLSSIQKTLQDTASIGDDELLKEADILGRDFTSKIKQARSQASIEKEMLDQMEERFSKYYSRARALTTRMVEGDTAGVAFHDELQRMSLDFNDLDAYIKASIKKADFATRDAFTRTRQSHQRFMNFLLIGTVVSVLLLLILSLILGRSITRPLEKVVLGLKHFVPGSNEIDDTSLGRDEVGELARAFNQMAAALRDTTVSKNYMESIIGSMNDALFVISREGRVRLVNQAARTILGYDEKELDGRPFSSILDKSEITTDGLLELVQQRAVANLEVSISTRAGTMVLVSLSASAIWEEHGGFGGMIILTRDQREIRELIDNLQTLTSEQSEQNWIKTNINQIIGLVQGRACLGDLADAVIKELVPLLGGGSGIFYIAERQDTEIGLRIRGCSAVCRNLNKNRVFKQGEGLVGQCALEKKPRLLSDIPTDYQPIGSGLGESPPRYILFQPILFEDALKGVIEIGSFKVITPSQEAFLNQLSDQLGVIIDNIEGRMQTEALLVETQQLAEALTKRTLETERQAEALQTANIELEHRTIELEETQQELVQQAHQAGMAEIAVNILHNVGNILNSVITSSEAIKLRIAKSKLRSLAMANQLLRQNEDRLDVFMSKEPKGRKLIQHLSKLEKTLGEEQGKVQSDIHRIIEKTQLIRDVIMAQQDYASGGFQNEALDLIEAVEDALKIMEIDIQYQDISVEKVFQPNIPQVMLQRTKLIHILVNILKNAREAMRDRKELSISVTRDKENAYIKISDTGVGIPPENLETIFAHGFSTKKKGHGFGLHSCANAMREMNAEMWAESKGPGTGATFVLKFPITLTSGLLAFGVP